MIAAGKLCRQLAIFDPKPAAEIFNRYIIYIALPALVIPVLQKLVFEYALIWLVALPWILMLLMAALVIAASWLTQWPRQVTGALLLLIPLGNTAFLGYPVVQALLGPEALPLAVIYDQFGSFVMLSSYGLIIAAHFSARQQPGMIEIMLRVVRFPPFVALLIALLPIPWPDSALQTFTAIGASLVPVACFAVGLQWRIRVANHHWLPLTFGLSSKLIVMPLLAAFILSKAGTSQALSEVGIIQSAMPPMITAGAIAVNAGMDEELVAAMLGFGIICSIFTLPLWQLLAL